MPETGFPWVANRSKSTNHPIICDTHLILLAELQIFFFKRCFIDSFLQKGFPGSSDDKASAYNAGDPGSIPGL